MRSVTRSRFEFLALTQDCGVYALDVNGSSSNVQACLWSMGGAHYLGSIPTGPVPAASSSVGGLKGRFGSKK
jgi:hypothetical protein